MGKQPMRAQVKPLRKVQLRPIIQQQKPAHRGAPRGSAGKGAGKGGAGGQWVYVPAGVSVKKVVPQMTRQPLAKGGKGGGRFGGRFGGRVAGKGPQAKAPSKYEDKLKKIDSSLKVWIGGLAEGTTWKDVEKHFISVAKPTVTDVMKKGTAVVAYKTVEDVETAVASLNGSELKGKTIEVDVWVQKPKSERPDKPKKPTLPMKAAVAKVKAKAKAVKKTVGKKGADKAANDKMREKLAAFPPEKKVWVGGLAESTTWKALEKHLSTVAKPKLTHVQKKKGVVVYESEEDVATVIAALNGSELDGAMIEVDVWTKVERPEKVAKAEVKKEEAE